MEEINLQVMEAVERFERVRVYLDDRVSESSK